MLLRSFHPIIQRPKNKCISGENVETGKSIGHPAAIRPKSEKVSLGEEPRGGPPKSEAQKMLKSLRKTSLEFAVVLVSIREIVDDNQPT